MELDGIVRVGFVDTTAQHDLLAHLVRPGGVGCVYEVWRCDLGSLVGDVSASAVFVCFFILFVCVCMCVFFSSFFFFVFSPPNSF